MHVLHAGTALDDSGRLVTAGGRVLAVTAVGSDVADARAKAYEGVSSISFPGAQWRHDIATDRWLRAERPRETTQAIEGQARPAPSHLDHDRPWETGP